MPELPEVETVRRMLEPLVVGARVQRAWARLPRITVPDPATFARRMKGRRMLAARRLGKHLWFPLDDGRHFRLHLGMTGRLEIAEPDAQNPHVHGIVTFDDGRSLVFEDPRTFGIIGIEDDLGFLEGMGPDPLAEDFDPDALAERLRGRSMRVKSALLDQRLVAGVGNIYADEICFLAGVHPGRRLSQLSRRRATAVVEHIRPVLERAIEAHGATLRNRRYQDIFGDSGEFQPAVYGRTGEPCRRCGTPIRRGLLGESPKARSYHWCPSCQT